MTYTYEGVNRMETTATTKGQVVIPSAVRKKLGIKSGTRLRIEVDETNGRIIMKPITREYVENWRGKFKGSRLTKELAAEKKREKKLQDRKLK